MKALMLILPEVIGIIGLWFPLSRYVRARQRRKRLLERKDT